MKKVKIADKSKRSVTDGVAYIRATFNNTLVNVTDSCGNTLYQTSAGACGFSGSKKSTPHAAGKAARLAAEDVIRRFEMKVVSVVINGPGFGAEAAAKELKKGGLTVTSIADKTPVAHNGCKLRKKRRV